MTGLPALEWACEGLRAWDSLSARFQIKPAAVTVDRQLEALAVPKAARGVFDPLDLRVESFSDRIGDAMRQVGQNILEMPAQRLREIAHRGEPRAHGPPIPPRKEDPTFWNGAQFPQATNRFLQGPRACGLERARAERSERAALRSGPLADARHQPEELRPRQPLIATLLECFLF